ncbi:LpqB family beta-propeller domain-containing protein [Nocardioides sp. SYSU DS0663]|uniref:LpqB family beta-propeller domain-containing protein n=1 Tax=Nocardioides sp. SYSU DS0663 TaxID=3416445 RepID=UPI003F4CA29E
MSRRPGRASRRLLADAVVAPVVASLVLTGCVSLPESGPVTEAGAGTGDAEVGGQYYFDPPPPPDGAPPAEIVDRFLDGMTAIPVSTSVARQYLTPEFRDSWSPKQGIITYDDFVAPRGSSPVSVRLVGAERYDSAGRWLGPVSSGEEVLDFPVELVDGQYRIASAPDALVVPQSWFEQRYERMSLYYFDPDAEVLVPEPVFVPRGDQLVSNLVSALLAGPPSDLSRVETTFLPAGATVELSVPVDDVVDIVVGTPGEAPTPTPEAVRLIVAQLAWTLRQVPTIDRFRLLVDGRPVQLPGGVTEFSVEEGAPYDPSGYQATSRLFGLRDGLLVSGVPGALASTDGPLGTRDLGVRSFGVDLAGETVAAVTDEGRTLLRAPVQDGGSGEGAVSVVSGASDLLRPAWDLEGRLWVVDRTPAGARVSTVTEDGGPVEVRVPGISGADVRSFLVSRDGSRIIAVVRARGRDQVRVSRLRYGENRLLSASPSRRLAWEGGRDLRIKGLGWRSPTSVAVLHRLAEDLYEVRTLSVDGAPAGAEAAATTMRGRFVSLAGTPVPDETVYAVTREALVDIANQGGPAIDLVEGTTAVRHVG